MNQSNEIQHDTLKVAFDEGEIIVYPTEAVMGVGCDPDNESAVSKLLSLKKRNVDKGLILVAANYSQLLPYVDDAAIPPGRRPDIFSSWPGPITWLMPKGLKAPKWITGQHAKIAPMQLEKLVSSVDLQEMFGGQLYSSRGAGAKPAARSRTKQGFKPRDNSTKRPSNSKSSSKSGSRSNTSKTRSRSKPKSPQRRRG